MGTCKDICNKNKNINNSNKNSFNPSNIENNKIGFSNIGNSCYINSFLQILFHCPIFLNEIYNLDRQYNMGKCLLKCIIELSKNHKEIKYLYLIKDFMKNISDYETSNQNDSQEFGKDLINQIIINIKKIENYERDLLSETNNDSENINNDIKKERYKHFLSKYQKNEIFIEKLFVVNECEIFCDNNKSNLMFNTFFGIELSFPTNKNNEYLTEYSLEDLLDFKYNTFTKKTIKNDITKLCRLPKILIISIIRTILNKDLIKSKLNFSEFLNLENYIDNELILIHLHSGNKKPINTKYKLFAINNKSGNFESYGHYYCQINIENTWFLFSDEIVKQINIDYSSKTVVGLFYELIENN